MIIYSTANMGVDTENYLLWVGVSYAAVLWKRNKEATLSAPNSELK